MKNYKRICITILFVLMAFILTSCGSLKNKIVGNWQCTDGSGEIMSFYKDGTLEVTSALGLSFVGSYEFIDNNSINVEMGGLLSAAGGKVYNVDITHDILTLDSRTASISYTKIK